MKRFFFLFLLPFVLVACNKDNSDPHVPEFFSL